MRSAAGTVTGVGVGGVSCGQSEHRWWAPLCLGPFRHPPAPRRSPLYNFRRQAPDPEGLLAEPSTARRMSLLPIPAKKQTQNENLYYRVFSRLENSIGLMEQFFQVSMSILRVMYLFISRLNKCI